MSNNSPAAKFIEEAVNHPEWLKIIESGSKESVVGLAKQHGFEATLEDLKGAARDLLSNGDRAREENGPSAKEIDEAASGMSVFQNDTGYGDDTGYAALYGVAGVILKL